MTIPPGQSVGPAGDQAAVAACVRHPDRPTGLRCSLCDRPACPECLREAAVGYQCVDCVADGRRTSRGWRATTVAGARPAETPVVVPVLVLVNIAVFAVTAIQARSLMNNNSAALFDVLGLWPQAVAGGAWWQLITAGFLHYGPIHIAMNMVALWIIGRDLELLLGRLRFTTVYLVSLVGGNVAVFLFGNPNGQEAGASGAVFGLMGGLLIAVFRLKLNPTSAITVIGLNLVLSVTIPNISLLGHVGGLVTGAVLTAAMIYSRPQQRTAWQLGAVIGLVALIVVLVVLRDAQLGSVTCVYHPSLQCFTG